MPAERWQFRLLGRFEVIHDGRLITGFHHLHKHGMVLAFLAYHRGKHRRESLAPALWPLSEHPTNNLSQVVVKLTRILGLPRLTQETLLQSSRDGTIGLCTELFARDIDDFYTAFLKARTAGDTRQKVEWFVEAVELYRGEFMLGYPSSEEYGWIEKPRLDYQAKFVDALVALGSLFRDLSITEESSAAKPYYKELAIVCEEHASQAVPLSVEECRLLKKWNEPAPAAPGLGSGSPRAKAVTSYNQGRRLWKLRSESALQESLTWFEKALAADPGYVLAYAGMADVYSLLGYYSYLQPRAAYERAKGWVQEAYCRDDQSSGDVTSAILTAEAWIRMVYDWEWVGAEEAFIEALQRNERNVTAHQWYSFFLMLQGNTQQSLDEINTAWDYEPASGILSKSVGERYHHKGLYAKAIEKYEEALREAPRYCLTHYCLGKAYEQLALSYRQVGLEEEGQEKFQNALEAFQCAIRLSDATQGPQNPSLIAGLAHAFAKSDQRQQALELLLRLKHQRATEGCYVSPVALATVHMGLEDDESALHCLEQALEEHPGDLILIHIDPRFRGLRDSRRFGRVLEVIGIHPALADARGHEVFE